MRYRDMHGSRTAAERNPNLVSPTRRNYSRKPKHPIRQMPLEARMAHLKEHYAQQKAEGEFSFRWAVRDCCFRYGLNTAEASIVLDADVDDVKWACDIIRQDAE